MAEFKRASNEFKYQIEAEMRHMELETERAKILPPVVAPQGTIASGAVIEADRASPGVTENAAAANAPAEIAESESANQASAKSVDA